MSLLTTLTSAKARLSPIVADIAAGLARLGFIGIAWFVAIVGAGLVVAVAAKIVITIWRHVV